MNPTQKCQRRSSLGGEPIRGQLTSSDGRRPARQETEARSSAEGKVSMLEKQLAEAVKKSDFATRQARAAARVPPMFDIRGPFRALESVRFGAWMRAPWPDALRL
jgi:hypothetical protein